MTVPGVQIAQDAMGIALLPKPRQADEPISEFEIQAVQQSSVDLLSIVSFCPSSSQACATVCASVLKRPSFV